MKAADVRKWMEGKDFENLLFRLYGTGELQRQRERYIDVLNRYVKRFGEGDLHIFSSPGRTEICGNHTDHNHGKILGGSINMDCAAVAASRGDDRVHIVSETYGQEIIIDIKDLAPSSKKAGTEDLIKGILQGCLHYGYNIGGFCAYITSDVIPSAGVSSSASFETLLCAILNTLFNEGKMDIFYYAHIGKYAENLYWDKASGLLDQMCCAVGGLVYIDFLNPENPRVERISFDFSKSGYDLVIVQTGRGHADLSAEYSSIPGEMKEAASYFGKEVLADLEESEFYQGLSGLRKRGNDRAILRAIHFFEENKRVDAQVKALQSGDFETFLKLINDSGNSSFKYLQNCFTNENYKEQGISVALALTEGFIKEKRAGACRVHGGGFAGVILAMLPNDLIEEYMTYIESFLGKGQAYRMGIRPKGSLCLDKEGKYG